MFEILAVIIQEVTEAFGHYCANSLDPWFAHLWAEMLMTLSIGPCIFCIIKFRGRVKNRLKVRRGLAKIVCFKGIVFIRFMQAWVFSLLLQYNVIKTSASYSYNDVSHLKNSLRE